MAFEKNYPTTFSISFSEEQDRYRKVFAEGYRVDGGDFKVKEGTWDAEWMCVADREEVTSWVPLQSGGRMVESQAKMEGLA